MRLLVALVLSLIAARAHAGCTTGSLEVFPDVHAHIPEKPHLVLTGTGIYVDELTGLASRAPRLVGEDGRAVSLTVRIVERGDASKVAAVLVPDESLAPGVLYKLELSPPPIGTDGKPSPLPQAPTIFSWHDRGGPTGGQLAVAWRVASGPTPPPRWRGRPSVKKEVVGPWCPYPAYVEVDAPIEDRDTVLAYELALMRADDHVVLARSLEAPERGPIAVGNLGCEVNAPLEPGVRYRVRITALGLDGTRVQAPGTVTLSAPRERRR